MPPPAPRECKEGAVKRANVAATSSSSLRLLILLVAIGVWFVVTTADPWPSSGGDTVTVRDNGATNPARGSRPGTVATIGDPGARTVGVSGRSVGGGDGAHVRAEVDAVLARCTGTPGDRRHLAALASEEGPGGVVVPGDWRRMASCVASRRRGLLRHFGLHVSKSAGTSLCNVFKKAGCSAPPENCWGKSWDNAHFRPQWMRSGADSRHFPSWFAMQKGGARNTTCNDVSRYMLHNKNSFVMSENFLPDNGHLCMGDSRFSNVVILRDPLDRLLSHWRMLTKRCKPDTHGFCDSFFLPTSNGTANNSSNKPRVTYNVTRMARVFDFITDNYYARSLNGRDVFFSRRAFGDEYRHASTDATDTAGPTTSGDTPAAEEVLSSALQNLRGFDWILILGDDEGNDIILQRGLGLANATLPRRRKGTAGTQRSLVTEEDVRRLLGMNRLDRLIWDEARKLHALDVVSLRQMQLHGGMDKDSGNKEEVEEEEDVDEDGEETIKSCCGNVCSTTENTTPILHT